MLSFLMCGGGLATLFIAVKRDRFGATGSFVTLGMGVFWVFNAAYQALRPPPFPAPLRIGFLALAIFLACFMPRPCYARGTYRAKSPAP